MDEGTKGTSAEEPAMKVQWPEQNCSGCLHIQHVAQIEW